MQAQGKPLRIGIIGAGAMGSLFASHFADAGADIWVYDKWREHIDAIRKAGLVVRRHNQERAVRIAATTDPASAGVCDVAIVMVKYHQTEAALRDASPMIGRNTRIITLQNGLGNAETIAALYPGNRIILGLTTLTSELLGPGRIESSFANRGETYLWPADHRPSTLVEEICALLTDGGINACAAPDIELRIWKKLIVNCCLNMVCAITGLSVGDLTRQPESWSLLDGIADEVATVALAKEIPLDHAMARAFLRQVADEAHAHEPSMLVDVRNRRRTEIECLNGAILREASRHNIAVPLNRAVYSLIRVIEDRYLGSGGHRDA